MIFPGVLDKLVSMFQTSAPLRGVPDAQPLAAGTWFDPIGEQMADVEQHEVVHGGHSGYTPSWIYRQVPGIGDAPQHVYATLALPPMSNIGAGDQPISFLRTIAPLSEQAFAMRYNGMPVPGGNFALTGLYAPQPMELLSNEIYAPKG